MYLNFSKDLRLTTSEESYVAIQNKIFPSYLQAPYCMVVWSDLVFGVRPNTKWLLSKFQLLLKITLQQLGNNNHTMNILLKAFQFSLLKTFDKAISNLENFQLKDFLFHD